MALMEGSQSDLFAAPPSRQQPRPAAASSTAHQPQEQQQQQEGERQKPGQQERGDNRAEEGAVHGAGIRRVEYAEVVEHQEGECNGSVVGVAAGRQGGGGGDVDGSDVLLGDKMGSMDGGGDMDAAAAAERRVDVFDAYIPLAREGGQGFQFGQAGGTENLTLAVESEGGDEAWIAQGIDTSNYGMGDSIFEEAIREIISKSSQAAAGYGDAAGEEEVERLDETQQLHTAPQAAESMLFTIDDMEGGSGPVQVLGLPQGPAGPSEFGSAGAVDATTSGQDLFGREEGQFVKAGGQSSDSLSVCDIPVSEHIECGPSPRKYSTDDALGDSPDCLQGVSWPTTFEQELYPSIQHDAEFVRAAEQPSYSSQVASPPHQVEENLLVPLNNEENSKCAQLSLSAGAEDDVEPLNGETSDLDETLDGADVAESGQESDEDSDMGVEGEEERGRSSSPPLSEANGIHPTVQPNSSTGCVATVAAAEGSTGQAEKTEKKHQGNGIRLSPANSKGTDKSFRTEEAIAEGPTEGEGIQLWVKWRGKWEAAIRCSAIDCPSTTLKAKPNYSKKKHVVVYFPSARLFSWVDTQHTCSMDENPVPLLTGTHASQREAVKDDFLPRRRMLLKLGGEILDISDRLHIHAVTESAQDVNVWKTFATEAAAATTYAELGELLVRLHLTIAPVYVKCRWISQRYAYWKEDCAKAGSASALQKLTKELINAVRWEDVAPLWNAAVQPELDPEWEHWKGDAFEEKDSEDDPDAKTKAAPPDESPIGAQISGASGSKRFKEQARARRQSQLSPDALESSAQKRLKMNSVSPEVQFSGATGSSSFGHATTAFRSPLVHLSPLLECGPSAFNSGLCTAFLKRKSRRCNRPAKEDINYCGKHKYLVDPGSTGEDLESEGGLAWESGLCSASLGMQFTRCEQQRSEGSVFCQTHIHLGTAPSADKKGEVLFSTSSQEESRCHGITTRGMQCTHKPQDGSPFCAKHLLQGNEGQDQGSEARTLTPGLEGSASKRARIPQNETGNTNSSPVLIQVGQVSSHHAIPTTHGNGFGQRSVITSTEVKVAGNDSVSRKRKWMSNFFSRQQSAQNVKSPITLGQDNLLPKVSPPVGNFPRCKGRTTRTDEQCSFRARPGHSLCTKHLLASDGGRKLIEEEGKGSSSSASNAKALLERYLNSAEAITSGSSAQGLVAKKQLLKLTRAEAAQDYSTAEELLNLVTMEMSKLEEILLSPSLPTDETKSEMTSVFPVLVNGNGQSSHAPGNTNVTRDPASVTCGLCGMLVVSQEGLGKHWRDYHRKEVVLFVKGYACRQCGHLYSRKHTVRRHWKKRHHNLPVRSPDWLAVCSTCNERFEHHDSLLQHMAAAHTDLLISPALRVTALESRAAIPVGSDAVAETLECDDCHEEFSTHWDLFHHKERTHRSLKKEVMNVAIEQSSSDVKQVENDNPSSQSEPQLFGCRNCDKKFPSVSELGRHADAMHSIGSFAGSAYSAGPSSNKSAYSSDSGRVKLQVRRKSDEKVSGLWQGAALGPRRSKKKGRFLKQMPEKNGDNKDVEKEALLLRMKAAVQTAQLRNLRQLKRGEVPATRPRKALYSLTKGGQMLPFDGDAKCENFPDDKELLDLAQSMCCQSKLLTALHQKYIKLPDQLLVRVSQVCTQANVKLEWLADGYLCPSGCKELRMAMDADECTSCERLVTVKEDETKPSKKDMDEVRRHELNSGYLDTKSKTVLICADLSNGQEPVPIICSVEQDVVDNWRTTHTDGSSSSSETFRPDSFSYITERVLNPSLGVDPENYKVGCSCEWPQCSPESCDHVDIFDNDNLEALDIYGQPMKGRFPYDNNGCIILEEGYLVYECNSSCHCQQACQNRVLQKGVTVKLEVFRTLHKGWAVRAAQMIPRGTFVCEYLGEVLHDEEANKRGERYDQVGCSYLYDIDAHLDTSGRIGRSKPFVIDATKHGNVARFINHSCAPNLVNYQVLVDSMDCQLAHIGLFASRDIENGEELAYDYRYKLLPGKGCPCHCGAPNCRGRLY